MYKFICICLVIMFPLLAWGDSEKDIQDPYKGVVVKKFEIKTITGDVKINIQASLNYVIEEEKFKLKLKIDDVSDSLMLEKNIHWKIFLQELRNTIYNKNWIEERNAVTEDIHQIYYWFYCLVHKSDNAYNSGIVFIKDKVLVVQQDGNRFGNYEYRMMVIDYIKRQEGDKQTNLSKLEARTAYIIDSIMYSIDDYVACLNDIYELDKNKSLVDKFNNILKHYYDTLNKKGSFDENAQTAANDANASEATGVISQDAERIQQLQALVSIIGNEFSEKASAGKNKISNNYPLAEKLKNKWKENKKLLCEIKKKIKDYNYLKSASFQNDIKKVELEVQIPLMDTIIIAKKSASKSNQKDTIYKLIIPHSLCKTLSNLDKSIAYQVLNEKEYGEEIKNFLLKYDQVRSYASEGSNASLILKNTVAQLLQIKNDTTYYNLPDDITGVQVHEIDSVALQFERGFLENVKVYTKHREKTYMFENIYAIGFSSKYNFKELSKMKLYERNTSGIFPCLYLGDVISYDETLSSYTRDYSPQDTVVSISPAQVPFSILQRSKMVDLFDAKIYSDLIGLLNETPNGMIQIEVDKRLNIRTIRKQVGNFRQNFGWLSYINLWGAFTKIEANNKGLPIRNLNRVQNGQIVSPNYVSNLDLLRYETFVLGTDVNGLVYDIPDAKVTGYFDLGIKYSHVPMLDSTRTVDYLGNVTVDAPVNKFDGHLLSLQPKITIEVRTEKRIHFKLSYWYYHSWLFSNNRFKQVMSYEKSDLSNLLLEPKARQIHSVEFYFRTQLSEISQSKLFIRARLHWQSGDANTFFPQLQLGYSYDLFYKR